MTVVNDHLEISRQFMRQAEGELRQGDSLQASEKAWGAAAGALKAVAEQRGWSHGRHRGLFPVVERMVRDGIGDVRQLLDILDLVV